MNVIYSLSIFCSLKSFSSYNLKYGYLLVQLCLRQMYGNKWKCKQSTHDEDIHWRSAAFRYYKIYLYNIYVVCWTTFRAAELVLINEAQPNFYIFQRLLPNATANLLRNQLLTGSRIFSESSLYPAQPCAFGARPAFIESLLAALLMPAFDQSLWLLPRNELGSPAHLLLMIFSKTFKAFLWTFVNFCECTFTRSFINWTFAFLLV